MKRVLAAAAMAVCLTSLIGCSKSGGADQMASMLNQEPAVASLTEGLGVTANQAIGGIGSMLSLAKNTATSDQFDQIKAAIPNSDTYMKALDGLGIKSSDLTNPAALKGAFAKLGMNAETAAKFVPAVADFAGKAGGDTVKGLINGLMGGM